MAFDWAVFYTAVETAISTTWADVTDDSGEGEGGGGIWETDRIARLDYEKIPTPYAVTQSTALLSVPDMGIVGAFYTADLTIHYVMRWHEGTKGLAQVRLKLEALEGYLLVTGIGASARVMEVLQFDWSETNPVNAEFLNANAEFVAGSLTVRIIVGEDTIV